MNLDPMAVAKLALASPFLFFLPGFFLTTDSMGIKNRAERIILAVFLSTATVAVALDVLERTVTRLTASNVALAVATINVLAGAAGLMRRLGRH